MLKILPLKYQPCGYYAVRRCFSSVVICGDSRDPKVFSQLGLDRRPADILITDPPYCLLNRRRKGGDLRDQKSVVKKVDNQITVPRFDDVAAYRQFTQQWLPLCVEKGLKPGAPLIIWTNALGKETIIKACVDLDYEVRGEFVWAKTTSNKDSDFDMLSSTKSEIMLRVYESALIFQHKSTWPKTTEERQALSRIDCTLPWSVISGYHDDHPEGRSLHSKRLISEHPCHKPLRALLPLVGVWSKPGDVILDPFAGSGGVISAVLRAGEGRTVRAVEVVPEWAAFSSSLIEEKTGSS